MHVLTGTALALLLITGVSTPTAVDAAPTAATVATQGAVTGSGAGTLA